MHLSREALNAFRERHVVVVGDVMLDEVARGDVRRISPEAPVPILEVTQRSHALGGAANAAANVASLGGRATIVAVVGSDAPAEMLGRMITSSAMTPRLVADAARPTTQKTRFVARGQQIVRIDQESRAPLTDDVRARLFTEIEAAAAIADAFVLSDYAKGVITPDLVAHVVSLCRARKIPVIADPKHRDLARYRGVSIVTPNQGELELAVGRALVTEDDFAEASLQVLRVLDGGALLATRGADGMTLFEPDQAPFHVAAAAKSVFDVTGAGDTVVATLAVALAAKWAVHDAILAASAAAGVVVSKTGTATISPDELLAALSPAERAVV